MRRFILAISAAIVMANASAFGRPIRLYTYEGLFKNADLVVIATAIGTKETTDKDMGDDYVGRNTKFVISHTLKGDIDGEQFDLLHYKFVGTVPPDNGPHLVDFKIAPPKETVQERKYILWNETPEYMLFLKRMEDGRYVPVSGHNDPLFSVRKITAPPEVENRKASQ